MKTLDIILIGVGAIGLGYLAYKNKDQFTKPLTDADNEPLRAGFDTGTNNGNGYQTEEEKPSADPVILSSNPVQSDIPVKNTEVISDGDVFHTGEKQSLIEMLIAKSSEPKPSIIETLIAKSSEPKPSVWDVLLNKPDGIPEYNTTTPFPEETPTLKPLVAQVSPSAPVVSIADTPEQYPTLLYNNSPQNIAPEQYDYGMGERQKINAYQLETF